MKHEEATYNSQVVRASRVKVKDQLSKSVKWPQPVSKAVKRKYDQEVKDIKAAARSRAKMVRI